MTGDGNMRSLRNIVFVVLVLICESAWAAKGTLLFVPLDNRPVCLDYTVQQHDGFRKLHGGAGKGFG